MKVDMPNDAIIRLDDPCDRRVLLAVELHDPVSLTLVHRGISVNAAGLDGRPIVSRSGRFVWMRERQAWPTRITVDPKTLPFAPPVPVAPPPPGDFDRPKDAEICIPIVLHPTPAYAFAPGVTAIRGSLCESLADDAPPVPQALVELAWRNLTTGDWVVADVPATTDHAGQFAVFMRLLPVSPARPDLVGVALSVQLRVTRAGETCATPDHFKFSADPAIPRGRLREGMPLAGALRLGWRELTE